MNKKKIILLSLVFLVLVPVFYFAIKKWLKPDIKTIYEAAVMVNSQNQNNPVEDMKSSLKSGDVLVVMNDGHSWSNTERTSYLILKMELTEDQKQKLVSADERDLTEEEIAKRFPDDPNMPKEERDRMEDEMKMQKEVIRTRAYRIDFAKIGFEPSMLYSGSKPFQGQIFDWGVVEKKPKLKD